MASYSTSLFMDWNEKFKASSNFSPFGEIRISLAFGLFFAEDASP